MAEDYFQINMKKRLYLFALVLCIAVRSKAGVIIGYQAGFYTRGLANIQSTTYYYNKVFNANFNYRNLFHGVYLGYRFEFSDGWIGMAWHNKHNSYVSDYTGTNSSAMKLGIKHRMNDLVFDAGFKFKHWGIGGGFDLAEFKVFTKRATHADYNSAKWGYADYGLPIKLMGLPDNPSFSLCIDYYLNRVVCLKSTWHFGIGSLSFANDGTLTFWEFYPNNLTFSLLFNLSKSY